VKVTATIRCDNIADLLVAAAAQDLDQSGFFGAQTLDGIVDLLGQVIGRWLTKSQQDVLKVTRSLFLQVMSQILAKLTVKKINDSKQFA
jgi:hypothetical protein